MINDTWGRMVRQIAAWHAGAPKGRSPEWYDARRAVVTASEVATIFGEQYIKAATLYRLAALKREQIEDGGPDSLRLEVGREIEALIARRVSKREGWQVYRGDRFLVHADAKLGATPDFWVYDPARPGEMGALEVKTVDPWARKRWSGDEPPIGYLLQLQAQLCVGASLVPPDGGVPVTWGAVATLAGFGVEPEVHRYDAQPDLWRVMQSGADDFFEKLGAGHQWPADYDADSSSIESIYRDSDAGKGLDLSEDDEATALVKSYHDLGDAERKAKAARKRAKARLLELAGDAAKVTVGDGYRLSLSVRKGSPGQVVTQEMVGTRINARKGARVLRSYAPKKVEDNNG